jgi:Fe2+ or Zn2+ uptake regulation protein
VRTARPVAGIPPGLIGPVVALLQSSLTPIRRRDLLEQLDRQGHRISLAGLNRVLQHLLQSGVTTESPDGVQLKR